MVMDELHKPEDVLTTAAIHCRMSALMEGNSRKKRKIHLSISWARRKPIRLDRLTELDQ